MHVFFVSSLSFWALDFIIFFAKLFHFVQSDDDDVIESALTEVCKKIKMHKPKKGEKQPKPSQNGKCVEEVAAAVWCWLLHLLLICSDMHSAVFLENF